MMERLSSWSRQARFAQCLILCAALGAAAPVRATDLLASARSTGLLRVPNTQSSPPWSLLDNRNPLAAYDVDNGALVFSNLGSKRIDATIISHFDGMKYAGVNNLPVNRAIAGMLADGAVALLSTQWVAVNYDMVGMIEKAKMQKE